MEYNTLRKKIKITDYGRNVYKLVEHAKKLKTKELRTRAAEVIVTVMSQVNPSVKTTNDYRRQLWEHLMVLSNWELDVDCPYELTRTDEMVFHPKPIQRKNKGARYPHYGRNLEALVAKIAEMEEGDEKELMTAYIVAQMKKTYMLYNRSVSTYVKVDDYEDIILRQLDDLSGGRLKQGNVKLDVNNFLYNAAQSMKPHKKKKKK